MEKQSQKKSLTILGIVVAVLLAGIILSPKAVHHESIKEAMRDAVLHTENKISLLGLSVNPSLISAFAVTGILLLFALLVRILFIPRMKMVPGKFQILLEEWVGFFRNLAEENSPHLNGFLGIYLFVAGTYIFIGTLFELFGIQAITTTGSSISLPAPLADINGAIAMGCLSYGVILSGGIRANKLKGIGLTLKEFSLPISMSFRLFGALLSGMLVTELVYYYITLSFILPVVVGVLFTALHALIQTYVLTMLTSYYYGEVSEVHSSKKVKNQKG